MGFVSLVDIAKAEVVREGAKVADLLLFLRQEAVTDPSIIATAIEGETNFVERVEQLLRIEGELDAKAAGLAEYVKTLQDKIKKLKAASESVRESIEEAFERAKVPQIAAASGTVFRRANPLAVTVVNEEAVPSEFFVFKLDATKATKAARDIAIRRNKLGETFIDGEEVELILALWKFDEENPQIAGVEVADEVTYSVQVRRN